MLKCKTRVHRNIHMGNKRKRRKITEKHIYTLIKRARTPVSLTDLCNHLGVLRKKEIADVLSGLVCSGSVTRLKGKRFAHTSQSTAITGTLWCTKSGNGFVIPSTEGFKDIFISSHHMKSAMHGDTVTVRIDPHSRKRRTEGWIIDVVSRNTKYISGHIESDGGIFYVTPEDTRYNDRFRIVSTAKTEKPRDGDFVVAKITGFSDKAEPACAITKIFKHGLNTVDTITEFITNKFDLPARFKKSVESESGRLSMESARADDRRDLRALNHITIDGELARDFDDAVYLDKVEDGYILCVSIADVSAFVIPGSGIDKEAYRRGTSVYFPGKVLPMLPQALSNDLCSLNPFEDKLAMTVEMRFNLHGEIIHTEFYTSIIRSIGRFTYKEVEEAVKNDVQLPESKASCLEMLGNMAELAIILKKRRQERGSLDFDLPESDILLDIEGGIRDIVKTERLLSHEIIEEFMISANESVARFLYDKQIPTLYRIHEEPDAEKIREIQTISSLFAGRQKRYTARHLVQSLLKDSKGTSHEFFLNRIVLRAMKQARYSASNSGHYGLASRYYLHFTSPIRRYPDLICHRSLKAALQGKEPCEGDFDQHAAHLSTLERKAMEAERELVDRTRILFMKNKLGKSYGGIISHVTSYGFYVELTDIFVEGLVLMSDLSNDYYRYEEDRYMIIGRRTRKIYRIGDPVYVRVVTADVEMKKLLFVPL